MIDEDEAAVYGALTRLRKENVLQAMRRSPALFLSYAALRRSLRSQHALLRGQPATVFVVTGGSSVRKSHVKAAELIASGSLDAKARRRWFNRKSLVHVLKPRLPRMAEREDPVFDDPGRLDVLIVLARSRSDIPSEVALIADAVVDLAKPTTGHIHAVRRLLGRAPVDERVAQAITKLDFRVLVQVASRHRLSDAAFRGLITAPHSMSSSPGPTLDELPGYSTLKPWARSFISDLTKVRDGEMDWSGMPRGVLLHGPPGTGKTLFAQALARSAGLPLISSSVSKWQAAGHLGDLLKAMTETFETAKRQQPAIVFIDELDSIGDRSTFRGQHVEYMRQVVNGLLEKIDGAEGRDQILVVAATNFKDAIDPALLRSGRIERHIRLDLPDAIERAEILRFHLAMVGHDKELADIAADLDGWSGADLDMLAREAKSSARRDGRSIHIMDLLESLPPLEKLSEGQARRVAVHEAGHAVAACLLDPGCKVSVGMKKAFRTIPSRDLASGWTRYESIEDRDILPTRGALENVICRTLAGAAAEGLIFGSTSTGFSGAADSDLGTASVIAAQMVLSYGMGRRLRFVVETHHVDLKRIGSLPIDLRDEISEVMEQQLDRAKAILTENPDFLDELAGELLAKGQVSTSDVAEMAEKHRNPIKDLARVLVR